MSFLFAYLLYRGLPGVYNQKVWDMARLLTMRSRLLSPDAAQSAQLLRHAVPEKVGFMVRLNRLEFSNVIDCS